VFIRLILIRVSLRPSVANFLLICVHLR
jgi:hypothetical protein